MRTSPRMPLLPLLASLGGLCRAFGLPGEARAGNGRAGGAGGCLEEQGEASIRICMARYLERNMPPWDADNRGTLELGILPTTAELALEARKNHSWAADVPWDIFKNWVLPYASVNEARSDWRRLFGATLGPLVAKATSRTEALQEANKGLWSALRPQAPIVFKHQQTPLIYDPMSTIAYGFASCTGISIVLIDALRSVGVPARLVGTPAWNGELKNGNHNWVEVWLEPGAVKADDDGWVFLEGAPAGGGSLSDPCSKWFCSPSKMAGTEVFAASFDRTTNETFYPMSWDLGNHHVPGVNRTAYYRKACAECGRRRLSLHI